MKTFKFYCPYCNQKLEAQDDMEGLETACPSCNNTLTIIKPKIILKAINNVSFTEKCRDGLHKTCVKSIPILKAFVRKSIFILHMTYKKAIPILKGIYKMILQCLKKNREAVHSFKFYCPYCNQKLEAQDDMEGVETTCPSCKNNISIIKSKLIVSKTIFGSSFISHEVVLVLVILSIVWFMLFIPILNLIIMGGTVFLSIVLFLCKYKKTACFIAVNSILAMSIVIVTSTNSPKASLSDSENMTKITSASSFSNTVSTTEKSRKRSKEIEALVRSLEELQESIQQAQRNRNYQNNQNSHPRSNADFVRYKKKCSVCFGTGFDPNSVIHAHCDVCNGTGFEAGGPTRSWRNVSGNNPMGYRNY